MTVLTVKECKKLTPRRETAETKPPTPTTGVSGAQDMPGLVSAHMDLPGAGDVGENDATAFIKAHPDWRPEDKTDNEEKEEG